MCKRTTWTFVKQIWYDFSFQKKISDLILIDMMNSSHLEEYLGQDKDEDDQWLKYSHCDKIELYILSKFCGFLKLSTKD